jgi:CheY-like chemotaxis protein
MTNGKTEPAQGQERAVAGPGRQQSLAAGLAIGRRRPHVERDRGHAGDDRCVLVVDDEPDVRAMFIEVLEDEGYRVLGAANGREALAQLRAADPRPQLILLDLMMPVMNGWEFRTEQLADPQLAEIPVVVISADGSTRQKAEGIGAHGYIRKPIQLDVLFALVARFCPA